MIKGPGTLLDAMGNLTDIGWSRQPLLDCNLENARFYDTFRFWQRYRIKRWDYYAITTPTHFFSFTLGDIGYIGQVFAYVIDFATGQYHEETTSSPFGQGVFLPRNSTSGDCLFNNGKVFMHFEVVAGGRKLTVNWPGFGGMGLFAEATFAVPPEHESMNIVIPIKDKRFYFNRKINCMPASGWAQYQGQRHELTPDKALGNLDWGRGVWEYASYWVWASSSGFLPDGRTIGLNLGYGFGDNSAATENAFILNGRMHKLGGVLFEFSNLNYKAPWKMTSPDGRLNLVFTPFFERVAKTDLVVLNSEVHQMFGRYNGTLVTDEGETIEVKDLIGFAEEHHAKW
jgi:hypothetical protein